jgi:hypothetical protein
MMIKKLTLQLAIDSEFVWAHCKSLYDVNQRRSRAVCALLRKWQLGAYLPITVRDGALKGWGTGGFFLKKTSAPLSLITIYHIE